MFNFCRSHGNSIIIKKNNLFITLLFNRYFFIVLHSNRFLVNKVADKLIAALHSCYTLTFCKFSFSGKAFKMFFKKTYLNLDMNKAHKNFLFFSSYIKILTVAKYKFSFVFFKTNDLKRFIYLLQFVRHLNIFTHRGIKIQRTIILKKRGKVSTYTTSITSKQ